MAITDSPTLVPSETNAVHQGRIVIVDDDPFMESALCQTLARCGDDTQGFPIGAEALVALRQTEVDILLCDLIMPEMDGIGATSSAVANGLC